CDCPPRTKIPMGESGNTLFLMPAGDNDLGVFGCKTIVQNLKNCARDLPSIQGVIQLFDATTGQPLSTIDAPSITAIRTAAMSALATRLMAKADAVTHGILGTGVQAIAHAESVACVRPIREIRIWGRDREKAEVVAKTVEARLGIEAHAAATSAEAARCDIISTVTAASEPVLFGQDLQPGAHINLVGSHTIDCREIDSAGVRRAVLLVVDSREGAKTEAGDFLIPFHEDGHGDPASLPEIGELLAKTDHLTRSATDITIFKSLGLAVQDLYAAHHVLTQLGNPDNQLR
ncbi:MAG: ornithine cyclodeaminase family protein, partial [Pseudomonadota bacterium]